MKPIILSSQVRRDLIAFMETLTGMPEAEALAKLPRATPCELARALKPPRLFAQRGGPTEHGQLCSTGVRMRRRLPLTETTDRIYRYVTRPIKPSS